MKRLIAGLLMLTAVLTLCGCQKNMDWYLNSKDAARSDYGKMDITDELIAEARNVALMDEDPLHRFDALELLYYYDEFRDTTNTEEVAASVMLSLDYADNAFMDSLILHNRKRKQQMDSDKLWEIAVANMTGAQREEMEALLSNPDCLDVEALIAARKAYVFLDSRGFLFGIEGLLKSGYGMDASVLLRQASIYFSDADEVLRFLRLYDSSLSALCTSGNGIASASADGGVQFEVDTGILPDLDSQTERAGNYHEGDTVVVLWYEGWREALRIGYGSEYPLDYMMRPQKIEDADIFIVVDEQRVSYGTYTSGGEAYTGDVTIAAYDAHSGEKVADLGRVQSHTYPPDSLPYSPYYENPDYNEVYDCIRLWIS